MDQLEQYKNYLKYIESQLTDDVVKTMTPEEKREYIQLFSQIQARINLLENLKWGEHYGWW